MMVCTRLYLAVVVLAFAATAHAWESSYESPSYLDEGWFTFPQGYTPVDESNTTDRGWTVVCGTGEAYDGDCAYKGWINAPSCEGASCRAYPGLHLEFQMPLVDVYWVKVDELEFEGSGWLSILTHATAEWSVNTMSLIGNGTSFNLEMAHLPFTRVGDPDFRLREWNRITTYLNWQPNGAGEVAIWINGVRTFEGTSALQGNLARAHYGAYGSGIRRAVVWNDAHEICTLGAPHVDYDVEPSCTGVRTRPLPPVILN